MDEKLDLEQRVRRLEDREEIKELTAQYCWHAVRGEGSRMAELFVADGVFDSSANGGNLLKGRDEIAKTFNSALTPAPVVVPLIHNHIMEIKGDEANGTCAVESRVGGGSLAEGSGNGFAGFYYDRYRREGGKWRFVERKFTRYHPTA